MKNKKTWILILAWVLIAAGALWAWAALTPLVLSSILTEQEMSDAVGIVAGSDGPTAILITGTVNWPLMIVQLVACAALIAVGIVLLVKQKKKR